MVYRYDLTLGLPHTNRRGLWEPLLLMHAGHYQWESIASAIGRPLSELRTVSGGEVYAAFYYIEERVPERTPIESFGLDATVRKEEQHGPDQRDGPVPASRLPRAARQQDGCRRC